MAEVLHSWIMGLFGAALLGALAMAITPEGPVRTVLRTLCGIVLALALVSPLLKLDMENYSLNMARYREESARLTEALAETENRLSRAIIQEECAAYIWDKAQNLGLSPDVVEVVAKWGGDCWIPDEAYVEASGTQEQRRALAGVLEAELGITAERQHWNEDD